jgi:predicted amidohydrolase
MYYERQVEQWTTLARARAIENGMFVFGCSHDVDTIPIAFAYSPNGECLLFSREVNRMIRVVIDLEQPYETVPFTDRTPHLYQQISEQSDEMP